MSSPRLSQDGTDSTVGSKYETTCLLFLSISREIVTGKSTCKRTRTRSYQLACFISSRQAGRASERGRPVADGGRARLVKLS